MVFPPTNLSLTKITKDSLRNKITNDATGSRCQEGAADDVLFHKLYLEYRKQAATWNQPQASRLGGVRHAPQVSQARLGHQ